MPKKTEYIPDDELTKAVSGLLTDEKLPELQALRENEVIILCCMKVVMDEDGETEPPTGGPVKLKKLSDLERLFIQDNAHYILTMDYHFWKEANERQQMARLFDALMDIKPEKTDAGLKLKKRQPGIEMKHPQTYGYFGAFDEPALVLRDAMKDVGRRLKDFVDDIAATEPEPAAEAEAGEQPAAEEAAEPAPEEGEPEPAPAKRGKAAVKK